MSSDRLTSSDKRALLLWILLGIVGAVFAHKYFFRAFPEASVDFRVSRAEALKRAQAFVSGLGVNISGYQSAIVFDVDDDAKTYLEREVGLQQANRLMSSELNIWYWDARFFRPQQEEEFHVRVSPSGDVVGYEHKISESQAGATLDRAAAETVAKNFLSGKLGIDQSAWQFLPEEVNSNHRPKRLDWSFTWEKRGFRAKDAPYRLQAAVRGDRVGGAQQYLQVPEAWKRSYAKLRSTNIFYNTVAIIPYIFLIGAALFTGISLTRRGQTSWRGAITLGIIIAIGLFFMRLNTWPLERFSYDTNSSYGSFVFQQIAIAVLFALSSALMTVIVLPGAEPLYRASQPGRLRLGKVFTRRGLRSKEFFSSSVVGLSLAAAHIGFIVAFYIVARHYGAWAPQDLNFDNSVNTTFPWISGVAIGLLASTSEEFLFRLFAIPFLQRLTGSRVLAVILPAFSWSFLHSAYPQEPGYIRGIEVGLIGIVAGLVMLRWGIVATLIWHYTVDASLVGLLLVRSNSLYFKISGIVVGAAAVAPLLFAVVSYLSRGRFEPDEDLLNGSAPAPGVSLVAAPSAAAESARGRRYDALSTGMIAFLALCLIAGGVLALRLKPASIGDYLKLSVNAREAKRQSDEILRQRKLDPNSYKHATLLVNTTDPVINEFLLERVGIAGANEIYAKQVPGALWRTRYFRDSQPEEYAVVLKPDGSLHSVHHVLAEAAQGASLSKDEAVALAEKFLREEKKIDLTQWTLLESDSDKRPHRLDHRLTWQQNAPLDTGAGPATAPADAVGYAYARIALVVLGDEVTDYRTFIKIPDDWRRKQSEMTLGRTALNVGAHYLFPIALGITVLIGFLSNLRSEAAQSIPWRRLALWSLWVLAAYALIVAFGDRLQFFFDRYDTAIPFKTMIASIGIGLLLGALFYVGALVVLFGCAWYYANRAFGEERIPDWTKMPALYYRDALWIGLGGAAALLGLEVLMETASRHWPTVHRAVDAAFGTDLDAVLPAASILGATLLHGLLFTGLVAVIASFVAAQLRAAWMRVLLFLLGALALMGSNWGGPADFVKQWLAQAIVLAVAAFGVRRVMRFNVLGCFVALASMALVGGAAELLRHPDSFYRANGYAVMLILLILPAWPLSLWRTRAANDRGQSGAAA